MPHLWVDDLNLRLIQLWRGRRDLRHRLFPCGLVRHLLGRKGGNTSAPVLRQEEIAPRGPPDQQDSAHSEAGRGAQRGLERNHLVPVVDIASAVRIGHRVPAGQKPCHVLAFRAMGNQQECNSKAALPLARHRQKSLCFSKSIF